MWCCQVRVERHSTFRYFPQSCIGGDPQLTKLQLKVHRRERRFNLIDASFASTLPANKIAEVHDLATAVKLLRAGPSSAYTY